MQGRLSPPVAGRLQAFPWTSWESEFALAAACGFNAIEWLFEAESFDENPVWTAAGRQRIRMRIESSGVSVRSMCADYFMSHPLFGAPALEVQAAVDVLKRLINCAAELDVPTILIPVLEVTAIRTEADKESLLEALRQPLEQAKSGRVRLALETELPAFEYKALVQAAGDPALGVYYDTGNAAARGFDAASDIEVLAPVLSGVHIKDRRHQGRSVPLGEGSVRFREAFAALQASEYVAPLIIQSTSAEDFVDAASAHLQFVRNCWNPGRVGGS